MSYTINPYLPRLRRDVASYSMSKGVRNASRHFGIPPGTISKWMKKAEKLGYHPIPTRSSKPKHHPKELGEEQIQAIVTERFKHNRCAEVVHQTLLNQGIKISLSSIKRTLDRRGLLKKRSPWKRFHPHVDRPYPLKAGDLTQIDTIHIMTEEKTRIYVFVLIDVFSRWVYARAYEKMNSRMMLQFVRQAQKQADFHFSMLQSDHGPEFGKWFVERIKKSHRHTRIGRPNDNAHVERFNRTIQEECLDGLPKIVPILNEKIKKYLKYYNTQRLHLGISLKSPIQLTNCFQAIG